MEDHHPISEAHLEMCCDICGDIGVIDAITTCPRCKISCEHIYCMRASMEHPQKDWCCDDCRQSNEMLSPASGTKEDLDRGSLLSTAGRLHQNSVPNNQPCDLRQNWIDRGKKVPPGKVKYIHAEEVIMLSSGAKLSGSPVKLACSSYPKYWKNAASALDRTPVKPKAIPAKFSMHIDKANPPLVTSKGLKSVRTNNSQLNVVHQQHLIHSFKGLREKDAVQAPLKEQSKDTFKNTAEIRVEKAISKTPSAASRKAICGQASVNSGGDAFPDVELQRTDPKAASIISILPDVRKCLSDPALDASWKGIFEIFNHPKYGEMNDGVQAHPPSRVRRKVYEFSKLMPEVLKFELVPCGDLWANLFQNYCLDREDIGLYFFPSNTERCKNYICLLEAMGAEDLAMRNLMDGVELLIFTSKVLRLDCQKWKGRHFLWGVFHSLRKSKIQANQVDDAHEFLVEWDSKQDVDMEIDMMAGKEVGRMDVAVPRESLQLLPTTLDTIAAASSAVSTDMDIDMMGGEEVGRMDVVVSRESVQVLSLAMDATDSREACGDIPPGFENIFRPIKIERPDDSDGQNISTLQLKNHSSDNFSKPIASQRLNPGCLQSPLNAKSEF